MKIHLITFRNIIGIYLVGGGLVFLFVLLYKLGFLGILNNLLPFIITVMVLLFFVLSGYLFVFSENKQLSYLLVRICLWVQTIQIVILGFTFKNFYGPYLGIGFTDTPELDFSFSYDFFTYKFANGFNKDSFEISFVLNIVSLILLILTYFNNKKEQLESKEVFFDSET